MAIHHLIPEHYFQRPHAVTRYLYLGRKQGRITALFQSHWAGRPNRPLLLEAYPDSVQQNRAFLALEDQRVFALSYIVQGEATLHKADGTAHPLKAGDLFQYNGQKVDEQWITTSSNCAECSLCFDGKTGALLSELELWDCAVGVLHPGVNDYLVQGYLDLYHSIRDQALPARALLRKCVQFFERIYPATSQAGSAHDFGARACAIIAANLSPRYSMCTAAKEMGIDYGSFRRRFRKEVGIAPISYQVKCRMDHARLLLQGHSVKETAAMLDYTDSSPFTRQFTKALGCSPKSYRQRQLAGAAATDPQEFPRTGLGNRRD